MTNEKGPSGANAEAFSSLSENAQYRATISHPVKFPSPTIQGCDHSAKHSRAVVRHVERPGGTARNLCRACWQQICASEVRAVLVSAWNNLWNVRPWVFGLRGVFGVLVEACAGVCTGIGASGGGRGL
jgi:hypothetical protein